jgi:co-chaperonin GroES (HSP10)
MENKTITLPLTDAEYSRAANVIAADAGTYRNRHEMDAPAVKRREIICLKLNGFGNFALSDAAVA